MRLQNSCSPSLLCEGTARRRLSISHEENPHENSTMVTSLSQIFNFQNCEKINSCSLRHLIYGILLALPKLTKTQCNCHSTSNLVSFLKIEHQQKNLLVVSKESVMFAYQPELFQNHKLICFSRNVAESWGLSQASGFFIHSFIDSQMFIKHRLCIRRYMGHWVMVMWNSGQ